MNPTRHAEIAAEQVAACLHWVYHVRTLNATERAQWLDAAHEWANTWLAWERLAQRIS